MAGKGRGGEEVDGGRETLTACPGNGSSYNRAHSDIMSHLSAAYISHLLTLPHIRILIHNVLITVTVDTLITVVG